MQVPVFVSHGQYYAYIQQSWEDKMVKRVPNVIKSYCKQMPSSGGSLSESTEGASFLLKPGKKRFIVMKVSQLTEDTASTESHLSALSTELAKAKPRDSVLLPLMKSTYPSHRLLFLNDATSAKHILNEYPALQRQTVVRIGTVLCVISNCLYL